MKQQIGNATIFNNESFFTILKDVDEAGMVFDAVITDPPYSSGGLFRSDRVMNTKEKYLNSEARHHYTDFTGDNRDQRSFFAWCVLWLSQLHHRCRDGAPCCLFTDWRQLPMTTDILQAAGFVWRGIVVWDKTPACRPLIGGFDNQCEFIVWGTKGPLVKPEDAGKLSGVYEFEPEEDPALSQLPWIEGKYTHRVDPKGDKYHIAGKPTPLMENVIKITRPGELIVDPFMGSATTGVAAIKHGRRFVGMEQHPGIFNVALERLRLASNQEALAV